MSSTRQQTDPKLTQESNDAIGRGVIEEVIAIMADDIEWTEAEGGPAGGTYRDLVGVNQETRTATNTQADESPLSRDIKDLVTESNAAVRTISPSNTILAPSNQGTR